MRHWSRFLLLSLSVSLIIAVLAVFAPETFSQSRFVSGTPVSLAERITYPATGVSGLPPCSPRVNGKSYLFTNAVYDSVTCDGAAGTWDHYLGNEPVIPPILTNFTITNSGGTFSATDLAGGILLNEEARAGDNVRILEFVYPATPFTMTMGVLHQQVAGNFHAFGVAIRNSAGAPLRTFAVANNGGTFFWRVQYTSFTVASASVNLIPLGGFPPKQYIRYSDDGVNRTIDWGQGQKYSLHTTPALVEGNTVGVTPNRIGVYLEVANAACGNNYILFHCDVDGVPCG